MFNTSMAYSHASQHSSQRWFLGGATLCSSRGLAESRASSSTMSLLSASSLAFNTAFHSLVFDHSAMNYDTDCIHLARCISASSGPFTDGVQTQDCSSNVQLWAMTITAPPASDLPSAL